MFCREKIIIKLIRSPDKNGRFVDSEDFLSQEEKHFVDSPGCEVLHNIMILNK